MIKRSKIANYLRKNSSKSKRAKGKIRVKTYRGGSRTVDEFWRKLKRSIKTALDRKKKKSIFGR